MSISYLRESWLWPLGKVGVLRRLRIVCDPAGWWSSGPAQAAGSDHAQIYDLHDASFVHFVVLKGEFCFQTFRKIEFGCSKLHKASGRMSFGIHLYSFNVRMTHDVREAMAKYYSITLIITMEGKKRKQPQNEGQTPVPL